MLKVTRLLAMAALLVASTALAGDNAERFFELYDIEGRLYRLQHMAAEEGVKLLAVDFFWDGCKPCKEALPKWRKLHEEYREKGLRVVVVDVRAGDDLPTAKRKLKEYFKAHPVPFPVVFDKYNMVAKDYGVVDADESVTLPQVFLLDPAGKLLLKTGNSDEAQAKIIELLQ
jgi:thiol-disulfide isomerase/thioredoxin